HLQRDDSQPAEAGSDQAAGKGEDEQETGEAVANLTQQSEGEPCRRRSADDGQKELLQGGLLDRVELLAGGEQIAEEVNSRTGAAEDAEVGERGAFEEEEEEEGNEPATSAEGLAEARQRGEEQADTESRQGGEVDAKEALVEQRGILRRV